MLVIKYDLLWLIISPNNECVRVCARVYVHIQYMLHYIAYYSQGCYLATSNWYSTLPQQNAGLTQNPDFSLKEDYVGHDSD